MGHISSPQTLTYATLGRRVSFQVLFAELHCCVCPFFVGAPGSQLHLLACVRVACHVSLRFLAWPRQSPVAGLLCHHSYFSQNRSVAVESHMAAAPETGGPAAAPQTWSRSESRETGPERRTSPPAKAAANGCGAVLSESSQTDDDVLTASNKTDAFLTRRRNDSIRVFPDRLFWPEREGISCTPLSLSVSQSLRVSVSLFLPVCHITSLGGLHTLTAPVTAVQFSLTTGSP